MIWAATRCLHELQEIKLETHDFAQRLFIPKMNTVIICYTKRT